MHESVLLKECIEYLNIKNDSIMVDCTLGYGGHSSEILKRINKGYLFAFDQDADAINYSKKRLDNIANNYEIIKNNFVNIKNELQKRNVTVDGILYDLGVSSPQLDEEERGFSFHNNALLDMRMDKSKNFKASDVVNEYSENELISILYKYGEEKYAKSIARGLVSNRPINTTLQLVDIIKDNVPEKYKRDKHPARKTFKAIRIEVNDELNVFRKSLKDSLDLLNINGRICVITFHSLEDKICKEIFKEVTSVKSELKSMPVIPEKYLPKYKVVKVLKPTKEEIEKNKRARSAKLRVIERIR